MTEQIETDKYIKCSKCKCKYINDAEHIKQDFGFNRLEEKFKTCLTCRTKKLEYNESHREERRGYSQTYFQENKDIILEKKRIYRDNNKDKIIEAKQKYNEKVKEQRKEKSYCKFCGAHVTIRGMSKHVTTQICKTYADKVKKCEASGLWKLKDNKMVRVDGSDENIES